MIQNAQIIGKDVLPERYNVETAPRGCKEFTVRAHVLAEILRNANRWIRGYESPASKSKQWGSLYDCLLLTPMQYGRRFCSTPPTYTNKKGEQSKWRNDLRIEEVAAWHEDHKGLEIVDADTNGSVHAAINRIKEDAQIMDLIDSSGHAVMIVAEWHDKPTGLVVPIKCLIDILPPSEHPVFGNSIWDLKSTLNASPRNFAMDAQRYNYELQAAFYLAMWNAASGEHRSEFGHVVQESFQPYEYRTPPPLLSQRFLEFGGLRYQAALRIYCDGLATGKWTSYERGSAWPITDCQDWYLNPEALYPPIEEPEEEADETQPEADLYGAN